MKTPRIRAIIAIGCLAVTAFIISCASAPSSPDQTNLKDRLTQADQMCNSREWITTSDRAACLSSVERPIIAKYANFAISSFDRFAQLRLIASNKADEIASDAIKARRELSRRNNIEYAKLKLIEPSVANIDGKLYREAASANVFAKCYAPQSTVWVVTCSMKVLYPIWQRNAPQTISAYDKYWESRLEIAKDFDSINTNAIWAKAAPQYTEDIKSALQFFQADLQKDYQTAVMSAERSNAETREKLSDSVGDVFEVIGKVALVSVVVVGLVAGGFLIAKASHGPVVMGAGVHVAKYLPLGSLAAIHA